MSVSDETVVRSSCLACGTVDLPVEAVTLYLVPGRTEPTYGFRCPRCFVHIRKSTSRQALALLVAAGVATVEVPAEAVEPHLGDPLTTDDLIDLGRALAATDNLAARAHPAELPGDATAPCAAWSPSAAGAE